MLPATSFGRVLTATRAPLIQSTANIPVAEVAPLEKQVGCIPYAHIVTSALNTNNYIQALDLTSSSVIEDETAQEQRRLSSATPLDLTNVSIKEVMDR